MEKSKKQQIIEEIKDALSKASSCVVIDFNGVNMETFTPFRKECAKEQVRLLVVKNTLAKHAVEGTPYEGISKFLSGMTALVLTMGDQVSGAKVVKKIAKKDERIGSCRPSEQRRASGEAACNNACCTSEFRAAA